MFPEAGDITSQAVPHPLRHRCVRHEPVDGTRIAQHAAHDKIAQVILYEVAMIGIGLGQ